MVSLETWRGLERHCLGVVSADLVLCLLSWSRVTWQDSFTLRLLHRHISVALIVSVGPKLWRHWCSIGIWASCMEHLVSDLANCLHQLYYCLWSHQCIADRPDWHCEQCVKACCVKWWQSRHSACFLSSILFFLIIVFLCLCFCASYFVALLVFLLSLSSSFLTCNSKIA